MPHFAWLMGLTVAFAALLRLWDLSGRTMHYDEAIHLHYAWNLANGEGFEHSPWMHGPFQIEMVAAVLKLVDSDFAGRLPYVLFGVALVAMPLLFRKQMGDWSVLAAAIMMAVSPTLMYFSRFGRNDILMAVWSLLLIASLWQYHQNSRNRYLYGAALVAALMLATKESSYFTLLFLAAAALALGWRQVWEVARRRMPPSGLDGAAGFLVLTVTLAMPQAAALVGWMLTPFGLEMLQHGDIGGMAGMPSPGSPPVSLPLLSVPTWTVLPVAALAASPVCIMRWRLDLSSDTAPAWERAVGMTAAVLSASVLVMVAASPVMQGHDLYWAGVLVTMLSAIGAVLLLHFRLRWSSRWIASIMGLPLLTAGVWTMLSGGAPGPLLMEWSGAPPDAASVPAAHLVSYCLIGGLFVVSVVMGVAWRGGQWLMMAALFYVVWLLTYTTFLQNGAGVYTGIWQSLGYWVSQHDVARGNQPWYYYIVMLSVYEQIALVFGGAAVVWLLRRRRPFDLIMAGWALASIVFYTVAGEKMPWLTVHLVAPLCLVAAMMTGPWLQFLVGCFPLRPRQWVLLALAPASVVMAVWLVWFSARGLSVELSVSLWLMLWLPLTLAVLWLCRKTLGGWRTAAVGVAALFLAVGFVAAARASYSHDDRYKEAMVFAQGSYDLQRSHDAMRSGGYLDEGRNGAVQVDSELWYPFQWYVRHEMDGRVAVGRLCGHEQDACHEMTGNAELGIYLESGKDPKHWVEPFAADPVMRNLLWFPEVYRRPGESRTSTPFWRQLGPDLKYLATAFFDADRLVTMIEYAVARNLEEDWYRSEYVQYRRSEAEQVPQAPVRISDEQQQYLPPPPFPSESR